MTAGLARDLAGALGAGPRSWRDGVIDRLNAEGEEFRGRVLRALSPDELGLFVDVVALQGEDGAVWNSAQGWRALRPVERAIHRVDLGLDQALPVALYDRLPAKRLSQGACWFGAAACRCLERALDHPSAVGLGRSGVRKLARRLHGPWRRSRAERRAARLARRPLPAVRRSVPIASPRPVSERFEVVEAYEPPSAAETEPPKRRPRRVSAYELDREVARVQELTGLEVYDPSRGW